MEPSACGETSLIVAGVDEAGCGPLAGPVMAAAVVLDARRPIVGLADSKTLSASRRETLAAEIRERAFAWAVARAEVCEIDALNIVQASLLAMQRAVLALDPMPGKVLVDGNRCPVLHCATQAIVKGDARVAAISAASILAKVERDRVMRRLHARYPEYHFDRHKGYPTPLHLAALEIHGASPEHRRSYAPVRRVLQRFGEKQG